MERKVKKSDVGKTFNFYNARFHEAFSATVAKVDRVTFTTSTGGVFDRTDSLATQQITEDCEPCTHGDCSFHSGR